MPKSKKDKKKKKKQEEVKITKPTVLVDSHPYTITPSYIYHNGLVFSIFQLYVRTGTNRYMSFQDMIDLVPLSTFEGVEIHFINKDSLIKGAEKTEIIKKNSNRSKTALDNAEKSEQKKKKNTKALTEARKSKIEDYNDYEFISSSAEPIVAFKWLLLISAHRESDIEDQIEKINTYLDQNHEGLQWDSMPGDQSVEYRKLFSRIVPTSRDHTSTGSNYGGLAIGLSRGLADKDGHPIGTDALSITQSTAWFDYNRSTVKQAFILAPSNSVVPRYANEEGQSPSISSIMAQSAANHITMTSSDARVHHIVLNQFDYVQGAIDGTFFAPADTAEIFTTYDVSKMTINPLQGFGSLDEVVPIFGRLVDKLVNIFDVLMGLNMQTDEKAIILDAIRDFYIVAGYWDIDADKSPEKTLIVNVTNPSRYSTMGDLLKSFTNLSTYAQTKNRATKADRIDSLKSILETAISKYMSVLGRTTSIKPTNAPQVFYNFKNINDDQLRQIQLLNIIEYITYTAKKGDVIVIHGFDSILAQVSLMLINPIKAAQDKGIRFIFAFDSIQSASEKLGKRNDIFEMQKYYYSDLDTDVDWCMIGKTLPQELDLVEKALNQDLGQTNRDNLQAKVPNQMMVHRRRGNVNNFVRVNPLI